MLKFFNKYRSGTKFMDRVSKEIGVERKLFKTSVTQMGVNFSLLGQAFELDELDLSEEVRLQKACMRIIPVARLGAAHLRIKFGDQPQIETLVFKMIDYQEAHIDIVDDPAEYRSTAMHQ